MKRLALSAIVLGVMLTTAAAYAQTATLRVSVPFNFVIGNQSFPAGTYDFQRLLGTPKATDVIGMVAVRRVDAYGYKVIVTHLEAAKAQGDSRLIFQRAAGQRYLSELCIAGDRLRQKFASSLPTAAEVANSPESSEEILAQLLVPRSRR
ncbi:MAG TPA: hypothetical protein VEI01_19980 [Terriglobales bacterium]|nr:hypothetical protein [Terriglobales bacterium]